MNVIVRNTDTNLLLNGIIIEIENYEDNGNYPVTETTSGSGLATFTDLPVTETFNLRFYDPTTPTVIATGTCTVLSSPCTVYYNYNETADISFHIIDSSTLNNVNLADVQIIHTSTIDVYTDTTNTLGVSTFEDVTAGTYQATIEKTGYVTNVGLYSTSGASNTIYLQPTSGVSDTELTVTVRTQNTLTPIPIAYVQM